MGTREKQPNVLVVFSDQQRWDTLGCYGQSLNLTPNLDRLAREGVMFEHAFTCQPVCGPARSCLQTGKFATETGCYRNGIALPEGEKTLAHWLSAQGYEVGYLGKWHLSSDQGLHLDRPLFECATKPIPPQRRGGYKDFWLAADALEFTSHSYDGHMFDGDGNQRGFPPGRYRVDVQTDWAIEYLESRNSKRPFFLFISYLEPHHQNDHRQFEGPRSSREKFADYLPPGDLWGLEGDWRKELPDYLGCCYSLDENFGRLRRTLEKLGVFDDTVVLFTSDHGCHFRTRNDEYKRSCHDGSLRIPLLMRGPGFRGGKVFDELVSLIDLPPTILQLAGASPPDAMRGKPVQQLFAGSPDWRQDIFAQISESHCGRAIRTQRWKYSVRAPLGVGHPDLKDSDIYFEDCLYDLALDRHEKHSLAADPHYAAIRSELAEILKVRMVEAGEREPEIHPIK